MKKDLWIKLLSVAWVLVFVVGWSVGAWYTNKNGHPVTVVTKEYTSQVDLIQQTQTVQDTLRRANPNLVLKQIQKAQDVYWITWVDEKNAYSGQYVDGQIITLNQAPLQPPAPTTP